MDASPARTALQTIVERWPDLTAALATRQNSDWPPSMGISRMREPDETGDGRIGDVRTLPIDVDVLDTMVAIEAALVALADRIASDIQRPAMSHAPRDAGWPLPDRALRDALADRDAADPRRWRYTGQRTAPAAATWLAQRLTARPGGPHRPLTLGHVRSIEDISRASASRIDRLLRTARRTTSTGRQHDGCGGTLHLSGGDGTDPEVVCDRCARSWRPAAAA